MFFTSNSLKRRDTLGEESCLRVRRKPATACVNLRRTVGLFEPRDDVFDNPLMELVEDVGVDRPEDIDAWKVFPVGVDHTQA